MPHGVRNLPGHWFTFILATSTFCLTSFSRTRRTSRERPATARLPRKSKNRSPALLAHNISDVACPQDTLIIGYGGDRYCPSDSFSPHSLRGECCYPFPSLTSFSPPSSPAPIVPSLSVFFSVIQVCFYEARVSSALVDVPISRSPFVGLCPPQTHTSYRSCDPSIAPSPAQSSVTLPSSVLGVCIASSL
ncbi:uncharacterized protein EV420DRAFT_354273 [Desarmillaria tabescens]|uniref:Uncharacterized protein n=1 Tax=Armillaria tabescens TaxID=1929756 RepID=A0AA39KCD4_ARMTA|nr:uncharacterized protein EV420DRAFT_354273 [Desarmillaria tabescens]KAK0458397.1 hypothetical protein EV420DRAFT_354273 [Desarmillaria tabescens]